MFARKIGRLVFTLDCHNVPSGIHSAHGAHSLGKVDAFKTAGLALWFNSSYHLEPHFHAKKAGEWEIRVYFLECTKGNMVFTMKWPKTGAGPNGSERRVLVQEVIAHRVALLVEWENKVIVKENM